MSTAIIVSVVLVILFFVGIVRIVQKAGYSSLFSVLALIPGVNVVAWFVFAFSEWPIETRCLN
jgi:uncharacterized membrane protein